jgi:hypothetical protein
LVASYRKIVRNIPTNNHDSCCDNDGQQNFHVS